MRTTPLPLFLKLLPAYLVIALLVYLQMTSFGSKVMKTAPIAVVTHTERVVQDATPVFISIPKISLDLQIQQGGYDYAKKDWILTDKSAYFAPMTAQPNDKEGNTLIYAHNFAPLFGKLKYLKPGDTVSIEVKDQREFTYELVSVEQVDPKNLTILQYEGAPQLTLLTCGGIWDTKRQMYFFKLQSIK